MNQIVDAVPVNLVDAVPVNLVDAVQVNLTDAVLVDNRDEWFKPPEYRMKVLIFEDTNSNLLDEFKKQIESSHYGRYYLIFTPTKDELDYKKDLRPRLKALMNEYYVWTPRFVIMDHVFTSCNDAVLGYPWYTVLPKRPARYDTNWIGFLCNVGSFWPERTETVQEFVKYFMEKYT
jgi:hypothetical protein